MNTYQKVGTLVLRLVGIGIFVLGIMGAVASMTHQPNEHLWAGIIWTVSGALILGLGRTIGSWIGGDPE